MQYELFGESEPLISLEDVFKAYYECRKNKRRTINALHFEVNFEQELIKLWQELNSGTYKIGRSIAFIVKKPVQREIFAADFRDRIVHHLVIGKINNLFEKEFIFDSYSCRPNKGTLVGVRRVSEMMRLCSNNWTKDCYILKMDIKSFFMSINKPILYQMLIRFLEEKYHAPDKPIILRLIKQIIFNNPEDNCLIKGNRSDWNGLPIYKSLFWVSKWCGLPIGNLTSQIFANFYLNGLDKFVAQTLKIPHYGRYVDDFVLIHQDKKVLLAAKERISDFLEQKFKLRLHPQKIYLQHCVKGVRFIGAVIKPYRIYVGNRSKGALYNKLFGIVSKMSQSLESTLCELKHFVCCMNSYFGMLKHYQTYRLRCHILRDLDKTFLSEALAPEYNAQKISLLKYFQPSFLKQRQIRNQRNYRRRYLNMQREKGYAV